MSQATKSSGEIVVGVAAMGVACGGERLVTHALGSCVGVAVHDPGTGIGGVAHLMLPDSAMQPERAERRPCMFVDTGLDALFDAVARAGADVSRLVVHVAGGATTRATEGIFAIGRRNVAAVRRWLWRRGVTAAAMDVGGTRSRTLYLDSAAGRCWILSEGETWELS